MSRVLAHCAPDRDASRRDVPVQSQRHRSREADKELMARIRQADDSAG